MRRGRVMPAFAAAGPSADWYITRATGAVSLVLLTASVVIGVLGPLRLTSPRWPRFAVEAMHRSVSLLVVLLLVLHVITSVLDPFAPIELADAVIPFTSPYRPLWLGLGAVGFDLIIAIVLTSLARRRIGLTAWRIVHWIAYLGWPVAVLHGLGTGTDTKQGWSLVLTSACTAAVLAAVLARLSAVRGRRGLAWRPALVLFALLTPAGLVAFTVAGPLQRGWARRAGTPRALLVSTRRRGGISTAGFPAGRAGIRAFSAALRGHVTQRTVPGGTLVDLSLRLAGRVSGRLRVRLAGTPMPGGGLSLTGSQVDLGAPALGRVLDGRLTRLAGQSLAARVTDGSGDALDLRADLSIDNSSGSVTGTLKASPPSTPGP